MKNIEKINILGTKFHNVTRAEAVTQIVDTLQGQEKASVFTPNPEIVIEAYNNTSLQAILNESDLLVPDGIGVVIGSRLIRRPLKERVAGYDMIQDVFSQMAGKDLSVYFFGAAPGVTEKAKEVMEAKYQGLNIVGTHNGYFDNDQEIVDAINKVKPDLLLVGLGAPNRSCG